MVVIEQRPRGGNYKWTLFRVMNESKAKLFLRMRQDDPKTEYRKRPANKPDK